MTLADAGRYKKRAKHRRTDLIRDQGQVLVQCLAERHHGVFADVVNPHVGRIEQPGHAGGVDDMTLPAGVLLGRCQHHRGEDAHAMDHTHHVDAQHPFPVFDRVFPNQTARANACVVKHQMRRTKAGQHRSAHRFHVAGTGHVEFEGQYLCPCRLHFLRGSIKCVLLNIHQHQVHAQPGTYARAFQAKA